MLAINLTELLTEQQDAPVKIDSVQLIDIGQDYMDFALEVAVDGQPATSMYVQIRI